MSYLKSFADSPIPIQHLNDVIPKDTVHDTIETAVVTINTALVNFIEVDIFGDVYINIKDDLVTILKEYCELAGYSICQDLMESKIHDVTKLRISFDLTELSTEFNPDVTGGLITLTELMKRRELILRPEQLAKAYAGINQILFRGAMKDWERSARWILHKDLAKKISEDYRMAGYDVVVLDVMDDYVGDIHYSENDRMVIITLKESM